jgi:integral membrane protein (TIGR00529 family)
VTSVAGIVAGFAVLAVFLALKRPVWLALLLASLAMSLVGMGPGALELLAETASERATVDLLVVMFLISTFVGLYRATGFINKLGEALVGALKKPKFVASLVPAAIGLLPVPGGALMSAPVVDAVGSRMGLSREKMLYVNVWFRHVIFLAYPLSAVMATAAAVAGTSVWSLALRQLPVMAAMVVAGYFLGFKGAKSSGAALGSSGSGRELAKTLAPLLVAISVAVLLDPFLSAWTSLFPVARLSMVLGLLLGTCLLLLLSRAGLKDVARAAFSRQTGELLVAGFSSMLLKNAFTALGGPGLVSSLFSGGLAALALAVATPYLASFATGSPLTGIVVGLSIAQALGHAGDWASLVYTAALLGYIASPAHLCYVYTAQYFGVPLTSAYKDVFASELAALATALVLFVAAP